MLQNSVTNVPEFALLSPEAAEPEAGGRTPAVNPCRPIGASGSRRGRSRRSERKCQRGAPAVCWRPSILSSIRSSGEDRSQPGSSLASSCCFFGKNSRALAASANMHF